MISNTNRRSVVDTYSLLEHEKVQNDDQTDQRNLRAPGTWRKLQCSLPRRGPHRESACIPVSASQPRAAASPYATSSSSTASDAPPTTSSTPQRPHCDTHYCSLIPFTCIIAASNTQQVQDARQEPELTSLYFRTASAFWWRTRTVTP